MDYVAEMERRERRPATLLRVMIDVAPNMIPGVMVRWNNAIVVRHMTEFMLFLAGAKWHPNGHCPTWIDGDCRCMVDG